MGLCARAVRPWVRPGLVVGLLGLIVHAWQVDAWAQSAKRRAGKASSEAGSRDYRSRHFLMHTDLPACKANDLLRSLETMLGQIAAYWGRPLSGTIECYAVQDLDHFATDDLYPTGLAEIRKKSGFTLTGTLTDGNRPKAIVYACDRSEVVHHEVVHAYCHQTFGRLGPTWYSEGMAELAHYWKNGDPAVHACDREIDFLRGRPPKSLAEVLSASDVSGDGWQNYSSRWALCHLLANNPNYAPQFRQLGIGLLSGKKASFDEVYGPKRRELAFEYRFFLERIDEGYRVDLCAWDWKKCSALLQASQPITATVLAARGWQPAGLAVAAGTEYEYAADGAWQTGADQVEVDADGDHEGRGRLVGVLMKEHRLSREFRLGRSGTFKFRTDGDLYLRCRDNWNELADNSGHMNVRISLKKKDHSLDHSILAETFPGP